MQYRRPEPSRYQMLERKEGLGVRTSKKKENLVMCEARGRKDLAVSLKNLDACQSFSVKFRTDLEHFQIIIS